MQSERTRSLVDEALGSRRPDYEAAFTSGSDTNVVGIRVTSSDAATARDAANAYGEVYLQLLDRDSDELIAATQRQVSASIQAISEQIAALDQTLSNADADSLQQVEAVVGPTRAALLDRRGVLERQLDKIQLLNGVDSSGGARVLTSAQEATRSLSDTVTPLLLGALLGLLLGLAAVALRERLAGTVADEEDVLAAGLTPRAVTALPVGVPHRAVPGRVSRADDESGYRGLAVALWPPHVNLPVGQTNLVADAGTRRDGAAMVAAGLARQLLRMGRRVAVVDADPQGRGVEQALGIPGAPGVAHVLRGEVTLDEALAHQEGGRLLVLTAGERAEPAALGTRAFAELVEDLGDRADIVLVVGAPLAGAADSLVVAPLVDRLIVLARRGRTRRRHLQALRRSIAALPVEVMPLARPDVVVHGRRWTDRFRRSRASTGSVLPTPAGVDEPPRPRIAQERVERDDLAVTHAPGSPSGVGARD